MVQGNVRLVLMDVLSVMGLRLMIASNVELLLILLYCTNTLALRLVRVSAPKDSSSIQALISIAKPVCLSAKRALPTPATVWLPTDVQADTSTISRQALA